MKSLKKLGLAAILGGTLIWPLHVPELVSSYVRGNVSTTLSKDLPRTPAGWTSSDRPLSDDKISAEQYHDYLNYDDVLVRTYSRKDGREQFTVYIGYWGPGKSTIVGVGGHTPSACLSGRGGKLMYLDPDHDYGFKDKSFKAVELTYFTFPDSQPMEVLFNHFVDGKRYTYTTPKLFRGQRRIENFGKFGVNFRHEQYALRIMTHESFRAYANDPGFQEVIKSISARVDR